MKAGSNHSDGAAGTGSAVIVFDGRNEDELRRLGLGDTPLLLKLTNPAGRPIQATRDLPGFWRGSWRDVAKEMKGRYPKHRWPEEPWAEKPSLKTKNAFQKSDG